LGDRKDIRPVRKCVPLILKVLFENGWRKKTKREPTEPGSPGKWLLKWRQVQGDECAGCVASLGRLVR